MEILDIADMSLRDLAMTYNRFAEQPVVKFKTLADGRNRLRSLLEAMGARDKGGDLYVLPAKPGTAAVARRRGPPKDFNLSWRLRLLERRRTRPGTYAERDMEVFVANEGALLVDFVDQLKDRWGTLRFWFRNGAIEFYE